MIGPYVSINEKVGRGFFDKNAHDSKLNASNRWKESNKIDSPPLPIFVKSTNGGTKMESRENQERGHTGGKGMRGGERVYKAWNARDFGAA